MGKMSKSHQISRRIYRNGKTARNQCIWLWHTGWHLLRSSTVSHCDIMRLTIFQQLRRGNMAWVMGASIQWLPFKRFKWNANVGHFSWAVTYAAFCGSECCAINNWEAPKRESQIMFCRQQLPRVFLETKNWIRYNSVDRAQIYDRRVLRQRVIFVSRRRNEENIWRSVHL